MEHDVKQTLLQRRSIRRYERDDIDAEDLDFIRQAIRNTPTSYNGQQFSVIEVADQEFKEQLAEVIKQKQIKTCKRVFFFCSDYNKIALAAKAKNLDYVPFETTADGLIVGTVDASLAMMSAIVAAVSRGLGVCPIGYARTVDPEKISLMLGLPKGVFVVCALTVGVPREMPDMHPKQPDDLVIFNERYGTDSMEEKLMAYDRAIMEYNLTRAGTKSTADWTGHILDYYREAMQKSLKAQLEKRGYTLKS